MNGLLTPKFRGKTALKPTQEDVPGNPLSQKFKWAIPENDRLQLCWVLQCSANYAVYHMLKQRGMIAFHHFSEIVILRANSLAAQPDSETSQQ